MAAVNGGVGACRVLDPFDLRIACLGDDLRQRIEQRLLVGRGNPGEEPANDLDVCVRHRYRRPAPSCPAALRMQVTRSQTIAVKYRATA
jgi:hypothetical protein